jgi:hypothetical protein
MTMADILAVVSGLILLGIAFPALLIILTLSFPQAVERASLLVGTNPRRLLWKGLLVLLLLFFTILILSKAFIGISKPFVLLGLLSGLSMTMLGGAGLINQLAGRFKKLSGSDRPILGLFFSALLIEFSAALPLVGWFVVLPVTLLIMLGAGCETILGSLTRNSQDVPVNNEKVLEL